MHANGHNGRSVHSRMKLNGQRTAHRVVEAIKASGCSSHSRFFLVAKNSGLADVPKEFDHVAASDRFSALVSGNPVPENYKIPECVFFLADAILADKWPQKRFSDFEGSSLQEPVQRFSPSSSPIIA